MTRGLNRVMLIGNVGAAPEVRTTAAGRRVASFSLATSRYTRGARGDGPDSPGSEGALRGGRRERTDWHRVVAWDALAQGVERRVGRGARLYVEGALDTRSWTDRAGRARYVTEIVAEDVILLDAREDDAASVGGDEFQSDREADDEG
ncbi:MAG: single-stranded DNA-binding protein [Longimicrobiales bacterium]